MLEQCLPAGPRHVVRVRFSDRGDGDFHVDAPVGALTRRRHALAPGPWTWLRQVHGATVIEVRAAGEGAGTPADGAVTEVPGVVLAVHSADCAPVVVAGDGVVAVAHAGWRGIVAGVVDAAIAAVVARSASPAVLLIGPCVRPAGYQFSLGDLARVEAAVGAPVRGATAEGRPALDLAAAVRAVAQRHGVASSDIGIDTAVPEWYSHRARGDAGRQATVAWLEATP